MRGQQTEADRIAELRDDPQCSQFDAHRCLCASCGRWVHLSGRAHKIFNWRRHKKGCTPQKSRSAITIIQSRSPTHSNYEIDELDDGMDEDCSSYSYSDEGHGMYSDHSQDSTRRNGVRLPSISTFSLSNSEDAHTPPLSSSGASTASESIHSMHLSQLHQRQHHHQRNGSANSLPLPLGGVARSSLPQRQPHSPQKSNSYDPVLASRVQCELCEMQIDLAEWNAHRRGCRERVRARRGSGSSRYDERESTRQYPNSAPPLQHSSRPPSRIVTNGLLDPPKPKGFPTLLPPLSSLTQDRTPLTCPPLMAKSFSATALPPILIPNANHYDHRDASYQRNHHHKLEPVSAENPQRPPPRKIAELLCHPHTSEPRHNSSTTPGKRYQTHSQSSTPTSYPHHHSRQDEFDYQWRRSYSPSAMIVSPSPSPPLPAHGHGHGYGYGRTRSLSPPSPFASDSDS